MLKIYIHDHSVTAVLSGTRWDAVRFYTPKLIRKLNNQVSGCRSFGIHVPGFSTTDIRGTVFENMEMPNYYSFVAKFNDVDITREDAIETARSNVLNEYHYDLRQQKRNLIIYLADWLGNVDDMLQTTIHEIDEEEPVVEYENAGEILNSISNGIKKFKDGVYDMAKTLNTNFEKIHKNSYYGETNVDVDALINAAPKELQNDIVKAATIVSSEDVDDDDDDEIEGDLVTPGSNFSTREPLTDRDDDDYTDVGNDIDSINFEEEEHHGDAEEVPPIEESIDILGDEEGEV